MSAGELILYTTDDGATEIQLRAIDGTAWLSLNRIADLFDRDKSVISRHIKAIFEDRELSPDSVVASYATTAADGKTYQVDHYRLETILDTFLATNELPLLRTAGGVSAKEAEKIAHDRYALFDARRKEAERRDSEEVDEVEELKRIAETAKAVSRKRPSAKKKGGKR
ncbi:MAG TPA: hypothetical protein ENI79_03000 [Rhodospirillales bacterium]|nr:hypothetical protein [Rhodospirillales bacterium]